MAELLLDMRIRVYPDYGGFDLHDPDCEATDSELVERSFEEIASSNGYRISVACAQSRAAVLVFLEAWTGQPNMKQDADWDSRWITLTLTCPTGHLLVNQRTMGPAANPVDLPLGPGTYTCHLAFRHREAATAAYESIDPTLAGQDWTDAVERIGGIEQYRLQMWAECDSMRTARCCWPVTHCRCD